MKKATVKWKIHFCWGSALASVILLAVITFWLGGKGNEIVSYVSFAGVLASVVLAVVAIVHSFVYNSYSQQNLWEMRTLISEASRVLMEKAGVLTSKADSMEQSSFSLIKFLQAPREHSSPDADLQGQEFSLNVSNCSTLGLLILYYLAECYRHNRKPLPDKLWLCLYGPVLGANFRLLEIFTEGLMDGISCFLESGTTKGVELTRLPSGFIGYIKQAINKRIGGADLDAESKSQLRAAMDRIEAYAEGGKVEFHGYGT